MPLRPHRQIVIRRYKSNGRTWHKSPSVDGSVVFLTLRAWTHPAISVMDFDSAGRCSGNRFLAHFLSTRHSQAEYGVNHLVQSSRLASPKNHHGNQVFGDRVFNVPGCNFTVPAIEATPTLELSLSADAPTH